MQDRGRQTVVRQVDMEAEKGWRREAGPQQYRCGGAGVRQVGRNNEVWPYVVKGEAW